MMSDLGRDLDVSSLNLDVRGLTQAHQGYGIVMLPPLPLNPLHYFILNPHQKYGGVL